MFLSAFYQLSTKNNVNSENLNFSELIPAAQLRRMSEVMKLSVFAALKTHQLAGKPNLDAIITATAKGCVSDTAKFLVSYHQQAVSPTAFIQSTHNAIAGQIALLLQSHAYNFTYTQGQNSFEAAFLDAKLLLSEGAQFVLCGYFDEMDEANSAEASFYLFSSSAMDENQARISSIDQLKDLCK